MNAGTWIKVGIFVAGCAVGAFVVRHQWQAERLELAQEAAKTAQATAAKIKELNNEKDAALSARDSALARANRLARDNRGYVERLRNAASASAMPDGAGGACQRRLSECQGLLAEGAGLAQEGSDMVGRLAADRAAVERLVKDRK